MELSAHGYYLPIACRFVPNDQWLVTHLNPSWKISEVKQWLLAKCMPSLFTPIPDIPRPTQKRRAVSPILFARRDEVDDAGDDSAEISQEGILYEEDEPLLADDVLNEKFKYVPPRQVQTTNSGADLIPKATPSTSLPQYTLLSFSTGQILEDHYPLSWYTVYPHELFELHAHTSIIKLPRDSIDNYVQPYFEAKVWALRGVTKDEEGGLPISKTVEKLGRMAEGSDFDKDRLLKKRRKMQWQEKWVVIHQGVLQLCKDRSDRAPTHSAKLSSLISLRGAGSLQHMKGNAFSLPFASPPSSHNSSPHPGGSPVISEKYIICAKFKARPSPDGQGPSWWRRGSRDAGGSEEVRKNSASADLTSTEEDYGVAEDSLQDDTIVIVMNMLDEGAYHNILRILHRHEPGASAFLPRKCRTRSPRRRSFSPISFAEGSPATSPERVQLLASLDSELPRYVRYPEWRCELVRRARRAGLGDVGRAMETMMFGSRRQDGEQSEAESPQFVRQPDDERRGRSRKWGIEFERESNSSEDDSASEREWEGWEGDILSRRARRDTSADSALNFDSNWIYPPTSTTVSPTSDYAFPPSLSRSSTQKDAGPSDASPRPVLSSYSSADSLLRRTIKRASPRKRRPIPSRADSPSLARTRPRSPLADYSDYDDDQPGSSVRPAFYDPSHPQVAYPSRESSFESNTSSRGAYQPSARISIPMSMAMTTITSTVSVGSESAQSERKKKGRGKYKGKDRERTIPSSNGPRQSRKRSSTVQAPSTPKSPLAPDLPSTPRQSAPRPNANINAAAGPSAMTEPSSSGSGKRETDTKSEGKSAKLKLTLSFAQVAALGTLTASSGRLPTSASATSVSSFESPKFAHPDDSD